MKPPQRTLVFILSGFFFWQITPAAFARNVTSLGRVEPGERMIRISAPPGSIVGELRVKRGDRVEAGELIARLREAPLYEIQLERARLQQALAESTLSQLRAGERPELIEAQESLITALQAEVRLQESRRERYTALLSGNHIDQDRYDEVASQSDSLQARIQREQRVLDSLRSGRQEEIRNAEIDVQIAQAHVAEAEVALALQHIRSPLTGDILAVHAWPGEIVDDTGALVSMGDTDNMTILAEVYESDLPLVRIGQRATFRGNAFVGEWEGQVTEIESVFQSSQVFSLDPAAHADRRIVIVRIRPDQPERLRSLSQAHVVVTIHVQ